MLSIIATMLMCSCGGIAIVKEPLHPSFSEKQPAMSSYTLKFSSQEGAGATNWQTCLDKHAENIAEELLGHVIGVRVSDPDKSRFHVQCRFVYELPQKLVFQGTLKLSVFDQDGNILFDDTGIGDYRLPGVIDPAGNSFRNTIFNTMARSMEPIIPKLRQFLSQEEKERRSLLARIETTIKPEDRYFRVITSKATVRELPDTKARKVARLPQADLVHVTGSLLSGWFQVSREGKPLGWVHKSLLREGFASALSYKQAKPPQLSVVAPAMQRYGTSQYWAVIIGISKYKYSGQNGLKNLIFADDDAKAFARVLSNLGWSESHIKLLINDKATKRNIEIALESWLTKAGPNDQIVLFWAGHGFPDPEDPEKVYFACYDTNISIPATGYRMDRVRAALEERKCRNVVLFADTCHAGKLITRGERGLSIIPKIERMHREQKTPKGWIFMVAADTDRKAIEHTSWTNGAFTHCLLNALSGKADGYLSSGAEDGVVTMGELKEYLNSAMPDETQRVLGVAKRPVITTSTGDPDIWNLTLQIK